MTTHTLLLLLLQVGPSLLGRMALGKMVAVRKALEGLLDSLKKGCKDVKGVANNGMPSDALKLQSATNAATTALRSLLQAAEQLGVAKADSPPSTACV